MAAVPSNSGTAAGHRRLAADPTVSPPEGSDRKDPTSTAAKRSGESNPNRATSATGNPTTRRGPNATNASSASGATYPSTPIDRATTLKSSPPGESTWTIPVHSAPTTIPAASDASVAADSRTSLRPSSRRHPYSTPPATRTPGRTTVPSSDSSMVTSGTARTAERTGAYNRRATKSAAPPRRAVPTATATAGLEGSVPIATIWRPNRATDTASVTVGDGSGLSNGRESRRAIRGASAAVEMSVRSLTASPPSERPTTAASD